MSQAAQEEGSEDALALCGGCWHDAFPALDPFRMPEGQRLWEVCAGCQTATHSGIYVLSGDLDEALGYPR